MRLALKPDNAGDQPQPATSRWSELPALCCQAAGGEATWADELTLAWLLAYAAADLMDSVQDQDDPQAWWVNVGTGAALATASGLYFSASLALDSLHQHPETASAASEIVQEFYAAFMVMTSGQLEDLATQQRDLDVYWRLAEAKSGMFFRLACRAGGRLATPDRDILDAFGDFGARLGELIQVKDDLEDVRLLRGPVRREHIRKIQASLPVVYARSVSPPEIQERLKSSLEAADASQQAVDELIGLLDYLGAAQYVHAEMERRRSLALAAIERAEARQPYKTALIHLLPELS